LALEDLTKFGLAMSFPDYPFLILLAPLAAAPIVGLLGWSIGPKISRIGVAAEVIALALALLVLYEVTARGPQTFHFSLGRDGIWQWTLYIDRLSAVMLAHIAAISTMIHLFSTRYMQQERGYALFHSLLAFTTFVLFGMVSSANLLTLFAFWQLVSWLLPLMSHNYEHSLTVRGAFRTFVMQRVGDVAFLAGVILAYKFYGTLDLQQLFARAAEARTAVFLWPGGFEISAITAVTMLIFVGAMSKSAQFPLHTWLPDALYAPTPVTALLHAGIINAGGFLLTRLAPLYALSPTTLHFVFAVGLLTAVLGSSMMLVQNDIKKTLGYSTIGQMGFMIMECGLGAYGLAIFHLIAHGLFKSSIFLNCGYVIHAARQEPRQPRRDGVNEPGEFSSLAWVTGFATTLFLPLIILLAAHGILNIPLGDSQGTTIFLFFGWATSSQAILTLYRLRAVASWKVAVSMLGVLFIVVVTYLFAAESFTNFLFPAPGEVARHYRAGALPSAMFDLLVTAFALVIIIGWILIYAVSHGRSIHMPQWVKTTQLHIYLLLINRLYLDTLSMRLRSPIAYAIDRLNRSRALPYIMGLLAVVPASRVADQLSDLSPFQIGRFIAVALLLPLFPFHGVYVKAVTHSKGYLSPLLGLSLPLLGAYGLANLSSEFPTGILGTVQALALLGALYSSLKALAQVRVPELVAFGSVASYSLLWWSTANSSPSDLATSVYVIAVALLTFGLLLSWQFLRRRYGKLELDRMHGLARVMPRFAVVFSLIVMAAAGLPFFALFSAQMELLLRPSLNISPGLVVVCLSWFLTSWYLFRMMQGLLFGSHQADMRYMDLRAAECTWLVILLVLLVMFGVFSAAWLQAQQSMNLHYSAMETILWHK
jgi:NADH-quinone oxidoreductase subunit L